MTTEEIIIYAIGAAQAIALGYLETLRRRGPCGSKSCQAQILQVQKNHAPKINAEATKKPNEAY